MISFLSYKAVLYTIDHFFSVAGLQLKKINTVCFQPGNSKVVIDFENKKIVFKLMNEAEQLQLLKGQLILKNISSFDAQVNVPTFLIDENVDFASIIDSALIINADIITLSFIMLSCYEEKLIEERDIYNRFEYRNSLASKYNFIDIPIVDEYAMLLRKWLLLFDPALEIRKRIGKVIPTHDIDGIQRFGSFFRNFKTIIGGDLIRRKSFTIAFESIKQCIKAVKDRKRDPLILAIELFINISKNAGLCSKFYFMGLQANQYDARYNIFKPEVKYCMDMIDKNNMVVGMHGGLNSYDNEGIFRQEKTNIESAYGKVINTGRQHFLMFDINKTLNIWQNCNIISDSTLGFPDREGFRCGTCHEYYLYDLKNDCKSKVKEHPLIVMEETLFKSSGNNTELALDKIIKLYSRCQAVEGDFVILWHNELVYRDYEMRFMEVYCKFMKLFS